MCSCKPEYSGISNRIFRALCNSWDQKDSQPSMLSTKQARRFYILLVLFTQLGWCEPFPSLVQWSDELSSAESLPNSSSSPQIPPLPPDDIFRSAGEKRMLHPRSSDMEALVTALCGIYSNMQPSSYRYSGRGTKKRIRQTALNEGLPPPQRLVSKAKEHRPRAEEHRPRPKVWIDWELGPVSESMHAYENSHHHQKDQGSMQQRQQLSETQESRSSSKKEELQAPPGKQDLRTHEERQEPRARILVRHYFPNQLEKPIRENSSATVRPQTLRRMRRDTRNSRDTVNDSSHLIRVELYRVVPSLNLSSLNETEETIFFRYFSKRRIKPFKAGFYSFGLDAAGSFIRMRTFTLNKLALNNLTAPKTDKDDYIIKQSDLIRALGLGEMKNLTKEVKEDFASDGLFNTGLKDEENAASATAFRAVTSKLTRSKSCDMLWKRLSRRNFAGFTVPECRGSLGTEQEIRVQVTMTLLPSELTLKENWYRVQTRSTILKRSYKLRRLYEDTHAGPSLHGTPVASSNHDFSLDAFPQDPHKRKSRSRRHDIERPKDWVEDGRDEPKVLPGIDLYEELGVEASKRALYEKQKIEASKRAQNVQNLRQLKHWLTSGYQVGYQIDLSACEGPEQPSIDRLTFGGMVKDFVYTRSSRRKKKHKRSNIFFTFSKTVMDSAMGLVQLNREVTVHRGRRVTVRIIKTFVDTQRTHEFAYSCKLYNSRRGRGDVKLFLEPSAYVDKVGNFDTLASTLSKGHSLRIVLDLSKCKSSRRDPTVIVGTSVTDYDIRNNGNAIEVSIPMPGPATSVRPSGSADRFLAYILENGDVMLTQVSDSTYTGRRKKGKGSLRLQLDQSYHCQFTDHKSFSASRGDKGKQSVNIYAKYGTF